MHIEGGDDSMKAHVLYGVNDIRFEDIAEPVPGKNEVLLKVEAVGICGSDIPRIYETGAHRHPLIPGHEFAGTICEAGEGVNIKKQGELIGKRVGVFPLIPCGECQPCKNKQYEMCRNYNYLGSRCDGGFAEYVKVPVWNLIELPDNVSFEDAAMLEPTAVGAHAMRRMIEAEFNSVISGNNELSNETDGQKDNTQEKKISGPLSGKSIAVIGLGTIGLLLVMHLINEGADKLYVVGNKEFQKEKALSLGVKLENYCDCKNDNVVEWLLEKSGGMGMDAIFECVGKNETYTQAIEAAAPAGRVMLLGNPASDMKLEKNVYWKILRNQLTVLGTWNSSFTKNADDDWHYVVNKLAKGDIHPSELISHRLSLDELEKGLHIMRDKTEDYVKVMVKPQL